MIIVDDQRLSRASIMKMIEWEKWGLEFVGEFPNGKEAYDSLAETLPDIVITDVRMPLMSGLQLVENISEEYPDICSIIVSGFDDYEYVRRSVQLEVVDYILKPVHKQELNDALEKIIRKRLSLKQAEEKSLLRLRESFFYFYLESVYEHREEMLEAFQDIQIGHIDDEVCAVMLERTTEKTAALLQRSMPDHHHILLKYRGVWLLIMIGKRIHHHEVEQALQRIRQQDNCGPFRIGEVMQGIEQLHESVQQAFSTSLAADQMQQALSAYEWESREQQMESTAIMHKVKAYIDQHYCENISLSGLAQQFYISPGYFSILFKQMFHVNFLEYITDLRMKHAGHLLIQHPDKKIHEVARLSGYQEIKYFRKLFRRYFGCTPQDFKGEQYIAKEPVSQHEHPV